MKSMNMGYSIRIVLDLNRHGANGQIGQVVLNRVIVVSQNESEDVF